MQLTVTLRERLRAIVQRPSAALREISAARFREAQEAERRQRALAEALRDTAEALIGTLDRDELLDRILDNLGRVLPHDAATIMLTDDEGAHVVRVVGHPVANPSPVESEQHFLIADFPTLRRMQDTARPVLIDDTSRSAEWARAPAGAPARSYLGVPLRARNAVVGFLNLIIATPGFYNREHAAQLQTFANQAAIAIDNAALFGDLQRANLELTLAYDTTLEGWSRAMDLRDKETEGHTRRVTEMTERLARAMGISDAELVHIRRGALMHDIGKMGVPDAVLLKPGPLSDAEWEKMRRHPEYAYELLSPIAYLRPAMDIPHAHHERWDGTGYPRGLRGEQIPLAARIFAVVDVWDALTSDRPYRPAWSADRALAYVQAETGAQFDPAVVRAFLELHSAGHLIAPAAHRLH